MRALKPWTFALDLFFGWNVIFIGKAPPLSIIHVKFCNFLSMANAGLFASCSRQLYLLEHHFNYIHKPSVRQAKNREKCEMYRYFHAWIRGNTLRDLTGEYQQVIFRIFRLLCGKSCGLPVDNVFQKSYCGRMDDILVDKTGLRNIIHILWITCG